MWTKNQYGEPFCWQHPSHRKSQVPGQREMSPAHRKAIAADVLYWFEEVLHFLDPDRWSFGVNRKGEYLLLDSPKHPDDFQHTDGTWSLTLWALSRVERKPHRDIELKMRRDDVHAAVTIILMNLIGVNQTNKDLKPYREAHKLPVLKKPDLIGKQKLLW